MEYFFKKYTGSADVLIELLKDWMRKDIELKEAQTHVCQSTLLILQEQLRTLKEE